VTPERSSYLNYTCPWTYPYFSIGGDGDDDKVPLRVATFTGCCSVPMYCSCIMYNCQLYIYVTSPSKCVALA